VDNAINPDGDSPSHWQGKDKDLLLLLKIGKFDENNLARHRY
jgi:hypothetical protein